MSPKLLQRVFYEFCKRRTMAQKEMSPGQNHRYQHSYSATSSGNTEFIKKRGQRHPPHLRGKEIGLYYARLNREKKKMKETALGTENGEDGDHLPVKRGCGQCHKQKDYQLPEVLFNEDIEKTLREIACFVIPSSIDQSDSSSKHHSIYNPSNVNVNNRLQFVNKNQFGLMRNEELDKKLYRKFRNRSGSSRLQIFRTKLPAYSMQHDILGALEENQVIVVMGETGCGKTTQVPQFILDSFVRVGKGSLCKVVCTQPRRISAITVAERVAQERDEPCGHQGEVGYQIRLESEMPADQGSVLFCTTGIVLQWLQENPLLCGITHIVVDEVHERDLLCDFLLIILKDILKIRSDLKVILMSATLDRENISAYFGGCPIMQIPGLTFPVEVFMLEDIIETTGFVPVDYHSKRKKYRMSRQQKLQKAKESDEKFDYLNSLQNQYSLQTIEVLESWEEEDINLNLVACLIKHICMHEKEGAVLVFLPGWEQIRKLKILITDDAFLSANSLVIPLHSLMPTINQKEAFEKPPQGKRKVVLATNIAETSITIDDIVFVIDTGKIKMQNFDHSLDIATLKPEWVAKSNAKQRKGRAGRTQSGLCFRLYTRFRENRLDDYQLPEMLRVRLEEIILKVKLLKLGFAQEFLQKALDPPSEVMVEKSVDLLKKLGALDEGEELTPLGYILAELPMAPQLGKMCILGALFSCLDPVLSIVASLSFREPFMIPLGQEKQVDKMKQKMAGAYKSDHVLLYHIIKGYERAVEHGYGPSYCYDHYLSTSTLKMLTNLKIQFAENLYRLRFISTCSPKEPDYNRNSDDMSVLKAVICGGLYPNVAVLHGKKKPHNKHVPLKAMDSSSGTIQFHPKSVNAASSDFRRMLLVYFLKVKSSQNFIHDSSYVNYFPLMLFAHKIELCDYYGFETMCIDDWLHLKCLPNSSVLVKDACDKVKAFLLWKFSTTSRNHENTLASEEKYFTEYIVKLFHFEDGILIGP